MKKINILIVMILVSCLIIGCTKEEQKEEKDPHAPVWLKEVTGDIVKATLNDDGNIIINEKDITDKVTYISYDAEGTTAGLLAVKDSKGKIKVVVNTCQACGGSPYAYFVQVDDKVQCQNCGNMFDIDELDNLVEDGCNPIALEDKKSKNGIITIGTKQLKELKEKFEEWKGPKA